MSNDYLDFSEIVRTIATLLGCQSLLTPRITRTVNLGCQSGFNRCDLGVGKSGCSGEDPGLVGPEKTHPGITTIDHGECVIVGVEDLVVALGVPVEFDVAVAFGVASGPGGASG